MKNSRYFSSMTNNVFVVQNLPEVVKGALFSKYSRSYLGLRELMEKEASDFNAFEEKSSDFYDRILDGFGDDSIAELGGAHLAVEQISMLAAKVIEDCRIGGSPLEKSTRYIYFDRKNEKGEWNYYRNVLGRHISRLRYLETCDNLFVTYSSLVARVRPHVELLMPIEAQLDANNVQVSRAVYNASVRAKTLDLLRGVLPTSALTNMGVFGNGRFFSGLLSKLDASELPELQELGRSAFTELDKVIPSFIKRSEPRHRNQIAMREYLSTVQKVKKSLASARSEDAILAGSAQVRLVTFNPTSLETLATMLCFEESGVSIEELRNGFEHFSREDFKNLFERFNKSRTNRRHKGPRALENVDFTFEIVGDFGMYRDLQRHRTLTQERQTLGCDLGYFIPQELIGTEFEEEYRSAMDQARETWLELVEVSSEEAQYVVPMAYNIRWYFKINLRALQWMCELRSQPAGHENYRRVAQEMVRKVLEVLPELECFFGFVDFNEYALGRLGQETRAEKSGL